MHRFLISCLFTGFSAVLSAAELDHVFIDPGFGGNPNNEAYVLGMASANNQTHAPTTSSSAGLSIPGLTTSESFTQLLQSALQQNLAQQIINSLTGQSSTPLKNGTYVLGADTVTISTAANGDKVVTITDSSGTTQFDIPAQ